MPGAVKVGEDDLDPLELDILLIRQPTLPQRLPQLPLRLLALAVGQEGRVGRRVLAELDAFRGRLGRRSFGLGGRRRRLGIVFEGERDLLLVLLASLGLGVPVRRSVRQRRRR